MKKSLNLILSFVLVALIAVAALTGCDDNTTGGSESTTQSQTQEQPAKSDDIGDNHDITDIGEGETVFRFEVTDDKGKKSAWNVSTNEKTVGAALLEVGLIEGDESEYGLYVKVVNGITADYDTNRSYWAFYVDGEYAMSGVETTDIESGKIYAFVYTKD